MKVVKIGDAKNNLSRYLAFVRRGGRIRILDRETPIADLTPVDLQTDGGDDDQSLLADLDACGMIRCGIKGALPKLVKLSRKMDAVAAMILSPFMVPLVSLSIPW